jgi:hypothetical protein
LKEELQKRTVQFNFRLSKTEFQQIEEEAKEFGASSVSDWVRIKALMFAKGYEIKKKLTQAPVAELAGATDSFGKLARLKKE